jgi:isocitrate/isopropylmalate dehydrogenase
LIDAARAIEKAVDELLISPQTRTRDLGGEANTRHFAAAAATRLRA